MRARGLTDGGSTQKAGFFVQDHPPSRKLSHTSNNFAGSSSTNPKVIIRQASVSRLQTPPSAPPTQRLPPPPSQADEPTASQFPGAVDSSLSSSPSFGSTISPAADVAGSPYEVQDNERRISERDPQAPQRHDPENPVAEESKTAPASPRTLKKSISNQTLSRRNIHTSPSATPKISPEATFRKPRNSTHPRLPIPHIPLSDRPSSASNASSFPSLPEFGGNQTPAPDSRKGSASGRRRLFSGSSISKSSLSQQTSNRNDDTLSTFGLLSDYDPYLGPYQAYLSTKGTRPSSSFWDEASDHMPASPVKSTSEYTPQVIMSREELARLEESVENSPAYSTRSRGFSVLSTSTMASDYDKEYDFSPVGLSPPPPATRPNSKQIRMSTNSFSAKSSSTLSRPNSPPLSILSTVGDHHESSMQNPSPALSSLSPQSLVMTSLPPPPRRRRPAVISGPDLPNPTPPPFPSYVSIQKATSMRSKFTVERSLHHGSILRKPSFLDISDDSDQATESEVELVTGSFLNLARESFDTLRSDA